MVMARMVQLHHEPRLKTVPIRVLPVAARTDNGAQNADDGLPSLAAAIGLACLATASSVSAQNWRVSASATAQETYTNNVDFAPQGQTQSDFVTSLTGTVGISGGSPRLKLNAALAATEVIDGRGRHTGSIAPVGALTANYEVIDNFAFVDASASLSQTYLSPFGPQPRDLVNATGNRYTAQAYSVGPYVKGLLPGNISYLVRDQNTWTTSSNAGNSAASVPTTYNNSISASLSKAASQWGWSLDYSRNYYDSGSIDGTSVTETVRGSLPYRIDPQLQIALRAGYESDRFLNHAVRSSIYGIGGQWQPTERTNVNGFWEHRFFGSGYSLDISHRLPRAALSASFSRDLSTYPQLALTIPAGASVAGYLNAAFTSRIQDPTERALAVEQFLARSGLPATLFTPVNFFSTTFLLQTSQRASLVLIGLRNSLAFTVFHVKSATVEGGDSELPSALLPASLQFGQNNTQTGVGVNFSHALSGLTNVNAYASASKVTSDSSGVENNVDRAVNANIGVSLGTQLGAYTSGTVGMGYSRFLPQGGANANGSSALNVFAAVTYTFR